VRRFRREHGIADAEVASWRERLAAARMDPNQRAAWRAEAQERLARFGSVDPSQIDIDRPITPACWSSIAAADVKEEAVEALFRDMNPSPQVSFAPAYRRAFLSVDFTPYVAQAAEISAKKGWTESLYEALREIAGRPPSIAEEAAFTVLGCDVHSLWRTRFGIPNDAPEPGAGAVAFARGQIPLLSLPIAEPAAGTLLSWSSEPQSHGLAPLHEDDWLKKARRQATGGVRAEEAVLVKVLESADAWFGDDPDAFAAALRAAWREAWQERRVRDVVDTALVTGKLKRALYTAGLVGNAGYDLLVPDRGSGRFLKVEIKRVEDLSNAAFFLSENERRQALSIGADWRLWLVAGDGQARDVTWVRASLDEAELPVGLVLKLGLRPGEWLVRVA